MKCKCGNKAHPVYNGMCEDCYNNQFDAPNLRTKVKPPLIRDPSKIKQINALGFKRKR